MGNHFPELVEKCFFPWPQQDLFDFPSISFIPSHQPPQPSCHPTDTLFTSALELYSSDCSIQTPLSRKLASAAGERLKALAFMWARLCLVTARGWYVLLPQCPVAISMAAC